MQRGERMTKQRGEQDDNERNECRSALEWRLSGLHRRIGLAIQQFQALMRSTTKEQRGTNLQ
jgi:hypothetical protein